jgi:uncharacterized membrane protein YccC
MTTMGVRFLPRRKQDRGWLSLMRLGLAGSAFRTRSYIGLRAALNIGIPLLAGVVTGHPSWGAVASLGGFAGFYGPSAPRSRRIRMAAGVGIALAVVVPLGSLCAPRAWLAVAFAGGVAATSSFVFLAWQIPPPREYLIVLAALAATGIPVGLTGALRECALVAAGAVVAGMVTAVPTLGRRRAWPEVRATATAWAAVAGVLAAAGTPGAAEARGHALASASQANEVLTQARVAPADVRWRSLAAAQLVLASALSVSIEARSPLDPRWAASVRRLAQLPPGEGSGAAALPVAGDPDLPGLRWAMGQAGRSLRGRASDQDEGGSGSRAMLGELRAALSPHAVVLPAALRIGVIVAAGAALGRALGLDHSYWIGLTAASALQANNVTFLIRRSLNRVAGTIAGVGLAWIVFAPHPPVIAVVAVAVCAQFAAEVLMPFLYGLAVTFVTVVALSVYDLATAGAGIGAAVGSRLLDTLIGAALAIVLRVVLWPRANATRLPYLQARTLRAAQEAFGGRWLGDGPSLERVQRRLQTELLNLRAVHRDVLADRVGATPASADHVTPVIDELAVLALGVPFDRPGPARADGEALVRRLGQLADALQTQTSPPDIGEPITLRGYPRTAAAVNLLGSVIQ